MDLRGKTILVTGAASGIGLAATKRLLESGAQIVATDINERALAGAEDLVSSDIHRVVHDVASPQDWQRVADEIAQKFGRIDGLVNNAGIMLTKPFADTHLEEYRRVMSINVESVWLSVQTMLPLLKNSANANKAGGTIVNISSIYGQIAGPMHAAYCASKGAVRLLTKALAVELAPLRIRVNSIHPGPVDTPLGMGGLQDIVQAGRLPDVETAKKMIEQKFPLGRWAVADDIVGGIAFLSSDDAAFITGAELTIDGGLSVL